jgi:RimJ/RimL family protein N-acetyltransferase
MPSIFIQRLDEVAYLAYAEWFSDQETTPWAQPPTRQWFTYVSNTDGVYAWGAYETGELVGVVQIDRTGDGTGSICIVVNPQYRKQGLGKLILSLVLDQPEVRRMRMITAEIDPENLASLRCFSAAGFVQVRAEPNEDGMLVFVYNNRR